MAEENDKEGNAAPEGANDESKNEGAGDEEKSPPKYVYNCARCGRFCKSQKKVPLTLQDLEMWAVDGTIHSIMHNLALEVAPDGFPQLVLKTPGADPDAKPGCPMYDEANKLCNIHSSMPIHCASFPLGFSGKHYFIRDTECAGLGNGTMTDEWLAECRERAENDHEAKVRTNLVLPAIQGVFFAWMMETSQRAVENLNDEQKKKLQDIVGSKVGLDKDGKDAGCGDGSASNGKDADCGCGDGSASNGKDADCGCGDGSASNDKDEDCGCGDGSAGNGKDADCGCGDGSTGNGKDEDCGCGNGSDTDSVGKEGNDHPHNPEKAGVDGRNGA